MTKRFSLPCAFAILSVACAARAGSPQVEPRAAVAAALRANEPGLADLAADPKAAWTAVDAPLLARHKVWRIEFATPAKPVLFFVAVGDDGKAFKLTAAPDAFAEVVRRAGVKVGSGADAVALARLFLETTRPTGRRHLVVESFDALPFLPSPDEAQRKAIDDLRARLGGEVGPVSATATATGWLVTAWQVRESGLDRLRIEVSREGGLVLTRETVAPDLPLVYVL